MGGGIGAPEHLIVNGKRLDGRKLDEIRPLKIMAGVIKNADGSCQLEFGKTKIVATVYGPREALPKHISRPDRAVITCDYTMASFSTPERGRPGPNRRSSEISNLIADSLAPAIMLQKYPRTMINVYITVTNANAGTRCAAITAAAVALADAGIEMRDLVTSLAAGKIENHLALDLFEVEDNFGDADVPIAVMPRTEEVTLLQMDGRLTPEEFKTILKMLRKQVHEIYKVQKQALISKYKQEKSEEEVEQ